MVINATENELRHKNQILFGNDTFANLKSYISESEEISGSKKSKEMFKNDNLFLIPEDFLWHLISWHVAPQSFIYEPLEEFILNCHQNGMILHLMRQILPKESMFIESESPPVLTMYMLSAGFYIWLITVLLSVIVFMLEHLYDLFQYYAES